MAVTAGLSAFVMFVVNAVNSCGFEAKYALNFASLRLRVPSRFVITPKFDR